MNSAEIHDAAFQFSEKGFLVIKRAFSPEKILAFQRALEKLVNIFLAKIPRTALTENLTTLTCDEKIVLLKNHDANHISIIQRIISRTPEFYALASCDSIIEIIRSVYGLANNSPIYMLNNGIVFTCPNDSNSTAISNFETDWHNDVFYTLPNSRFWQVWVPLLHNATREIGTLMLCPGSHKQGIGMQRINMKADYNHRYTIVPDSLKSFSPISVEVALGDMMIFDSRLVHKSGINNSDFVRCTMLGAYHDASLPEFSPVGFEYKYYGKTPEEYFYENFGGDEVKKIMYANLADDDLARRRGV